MKRVTRERAVKKGGARANAGRKADDPTRGAKRVGSLSLYEDTWAKLKEEGGSMSATVQKALDEYFAGF